MENKNAITSVIEKRKKEIEEIDEYLMSETVSVAMALDSLRKALNQVNTHINNREIEKASSCGYNEVASEFVYVQRALAGLQIAEQKKQSFISDIALQTKSSYEDVAPYVNEKLIFSVKKSDDDLYGKAAELAIKEGYASQKETNELLDSI